VHEEEKESFVEISLKGAIGLLVLSVFLYPLIHVYEAIVPERIYFCDSGKDYISGMVENINC